jgi:hypothetical protein
LFGIKNIKEDIKMKWTPFTLHVKVTPQSSQDNGYRVSYMRSLQKFGQDLYDALISESDFNIAMPGGGQFTLKNSYEDARYFNQDTEVTSSFTRQSGYGGAAVKPQFGDYPAQLMITGFYQSANPVLPNYAAHSVISGGKYYSGTNSSSNVNVPTTALNNEVKALKATVDSLIIDYLPTYANAQVFRLDYSGVIFGDRGFTFPI